MEKGKVRSRHNVAARLGTAAVAGGILFTGCSSAASTTPNQPNVQYIAQVGESYAPDGQATCSVVAKEAGRNALAVTIKLGSMLGVKGGTFSIREDSIATGFGVAFTDGRMPHDNVEVSDPGDRATSLDVTGWAYYFGAAGVQRSFECIKDFYPPSSLPEG